MFLKKLFGDPLGDLDREYVRDMVYLALAHPITGHSDPRKVDELSSLILQGKTPATEWFEQFGQGLLVVLAHEEIRHWRGTDGSLSFANMAATHYDLEVLPILETLLRNGIHPRYETYVKQRGRLDGLSREGIQNSTKSANQLLRILACDTANAVIDRRLDQSKRDRRKLTSKEELHIEGIINAFELTANNPEYRGSVPIDYLVYHYKKYKEYMGL